MTEKSGLGLSVCPWCNDEMALVEGVLPGHTPSYVAAVDDRPCPCSGLTLERAQDKTDEAIMHHAATGE